MGGCDGADGRAERGVAASAAARRLASSGGRRVAVLIPHRASTCLAVPTILGLEMADEKAIAASLAIVGPRTSLSNVERADMAEAIEPVRTSR